MTRLLALAAGLPLYTRNGDDFQALTYYRLDAPGASGTDVAFGEGGSDEINGDTQSDLLSGGGGSDTIDGGKGGDELGDDVGVAGAVAALVDDEEAAVRLGGH